MLGQQERGVERSTERANKLSLRGRRKARVQIGVEEVFMFASKSENRDRAVESVFKLGLGIGLGTLTLTLTLTLNLTLTLTGLYRSRRK